MADRGALGMLDELNEAEELVGAEVLRASAELDAALSDRDGPATRLLLLRGPPASGKTVVAARALRRAGFDVKSFVPGLTAGQLLAECLEFAMLAGSVESMVAGARKPRALFVDGSFADGKSLARLYDQLAKQKRAIVILACAGCASRMPEVLRRVNRVVVLPYPTPAETLARFWKYAEHRGMMDLAKRRDDVAKRAETSEGCIHRFLIGLESLLAGTVAEYTFYDTTILQDVQRCVRNVCAGSIGFKEIERTVSTEPALAALIAHGELHDNCSLSDYRAVLDDFARCSELPGTQRVLMTALFASCAALYAKKARARARAAPFVSVFPKCYTVMSTRAAAAKRAAAARDATEGDATGGRPRDEPEISEMMGLCLGGVAPSPPTL